MIGTMTALALAIGAAAPASNPAAAVPAPVSLLGAAKAAALSQFAEAAMRLQLAKEGYTDMHPFRKAGSSWRTTARHGGRRYALQVEPGGTTQRTLID